MIFIRLCLAICLTLSSQLSFGLSPSHNIQDISEDLKLHEALKQDFKTFIFDQEALLPNNPSNNYENVLPPSIWDTLILLMNNKKTVVIMGDSSPQDLFLAFQRHHKKPETQHNPTTSLFPYLCFHDKSTQSFIWADRIDSCLRDNGNMERTTPFRVYKQWEALFLEQRFTPIALFSNQQRLLTPKPNTSLFSVEEQENSTLAKEQAIIQVPQTHASHNYTRGQGTLSVLQQWLLKHAPQQILPGMLTKLTSNNQFIQSVRNHLSIPETKQPVFQWDYLGAGAEKVVYRLNVAWSDQGRDHAQQFKLASPLESLQSQTRHRNRG